MSMFVYTKPIWLNCVYQDTRFQIMFPFELTHLFFVLSRTPIFKPSTTQNQICEHVGKLTTSLIHNDVQYIYFKWLVHVKICERFEICMHLEIWPIHFRHSLSVREKCLCQKIKNVRNRQLANRVWEYFRKAYCWAT